jgi:hypothetical protein
VLIAEPALTKDLIDNDEDMCILVIRLTPAPPTMDRFVAEPKILHPELILEKFLKLIDDPRAVKSKMLVLLPNRANDLIEILLPTCM